MNEVPDTELFSAYLDGELTADEQTRVEQILADSPGARRLLEELRALGSTLQGLPREKLAEDLSARVLQVAERRMLLPDDAGNKPSAGRAAETLKEPDGPIGWLGIPWREISWRGMLSKRALVWSGVVVATAIIISFTSPPPPKPNRDLARLDDRARLDNPSGLEKAPAAGAPAAAGDERSKSSISDGSWEAPAGPPRKQPSDERLAENHKVADGKEREAKTAAGSVTRNEKAAAESVPRKEKDRPDIDDLKKKLALRNGAALPSKAAKVAAAGEAAKKAPAEGEPGEGYVSKLEDKAVPSANVKPGLEKDASEDIDVANHRVAKGSDTTPLMNGTGFAASNANSLSASAAAPTAGNWKGAQAPRSRFVGPMAPAVTIVHLDVAAPAVRDRIFENLLAYQGLGSEQNSTNQNATNLVQNDFHRPLGQLEQAGRGGGQVLDRRQNLAADNRGVQLGASPSAPSSPVVSGALNQQQLPENVLQKPVGTAAKRDSQLIFGFDASPEQLAIVLKQIGERSDSFSAPEIEVAAPDSPAANLFAEHYRRGTNNFSGGNGGGTSANRAEQQQQVKGDAGAAKFAREGAAQPQAPTAAPGSAAQTAYPAAGAARQHVVFVLHVVDRLAPDASRVPLPAAPAK